MNGSGQMIMRAAALGAALWAVYAVIAAFCASDPQADLIMAAHRGDDATVAQLLAAGLSPDTKDPGVFGGVDSVLMVAAGAGHDRAATLLLDAGADVNWESEDGTTAVMSAAQAGKPTMVQLLLKHGANASARDRLGFSALDKARVYGPTLGHDAGSRILTRAR